MTRGLSGATLRPLRPTPRWSRGVAGERETLLGDEERTGEGRCQGSGGWQVRREDGRLGESRRRESFNGGFRCKACRESRSEAKREASREGSTEVGREVGREVGACVEGECVNSRREIREDAPGCQQVWKEAREFCASEACREAHRREADACREWEGRERKAREWEAREWEAREWEAREWEAREWQASRRRNACERQNPKR